MCKIHVKHASYTASRGWKMEERMYIENKLEWNTRQLEYTFMY